ncbi:16S rRNA (cytosine(1402)-N(4))-methyltransferase RsmH [Crocosphaera watsonii WH 8501]|uniref:Ribosomal RNA small subunit methyltransferase H n=5 Tax=Crocosphaera watsonii TaxID=263511 RepID=Q4BWQ2_CROWT|nr:MULTISPECIES: 16S rRNA (cytosine(1402)-N(4))-methyltransferase RsmH [Crocosphaera]EAM48336.1 methyltransferase [Crocosphaera watsonii WH 8501]EHJ10118.1 methyltransferase [Crocosphaera watsonii WH 0003]MCH2246822.1 16S rRNA (cytosine(1402)-N(4))-methyltransferase RsmH [Crocosphaera sp.]NQZ61811.1 16S rRNA (cytosine(1402)-N(4))-methyltransferase RsmH [Crocosphaera sp.]CCQ51855.1 rRNA small subunit methyltransferase H [Crocosphaera watsonii WH 8502]
MPTPPTLHTPVLPQALLDGLAIDPNGHYLDATLGRGGHSRLILATFPDVRVTGIDLDDEAIATTQGNLSELFGDRLQVWQGNFADYSGKIGEFNGIIADLGVSSPQFDVAERGFSFRHQAPLDMRMNRQQSLTAAEIINHWDQTSLADLFYQYGEERRSRVIARRIVQQRPFETTTALAEAIALCFPPKQRYGRIHPATRVFQALRIAVNDELGSLERFLEKAPHWLKPGGRIGIISFHSLEDRRVKYSFRDSLLLDVVTKKPIIPQAEEQANNPRSRSAKLRFAQRKASEQ